jgi:hypothetical protein
MPSPSVLRLLNAFNSTVSLPGNGQPICSFWPGQRRRELPLPNAFNSSMACRTSGLGVVAIASTIRAIGLPRLVMVISSPCATVMGFGLSQIGPRPVRLGLLRRTALTSPLSGFVNRSRCRLATLHLPSRNDQA